MPKTKRTYSLWSNVLIGLDRLSVRKLPARLQEIKSTIAAGLDPNVPDAHGDTAFSYLIHAGYLSSKIRKTMEVLLDEGANPLAGGKPWPRIAIAQDTLLRDTIMELLLAKEKEGARLRADDGSNILHLLSATPMSFLIALHRAAKLMKSEQGKVLGSVDYSDPASDVGVLARWLSERDTERGETPLHVLCRHFLEQPGARVAQNDGAFWIGVCLARNLGVDFSWTDRAGISIARHIVNLAHQGLATPEGEAGEVATFALAMGMREDEVALHTRRERRL